MHEPAAGFTGIAVSLHDDQITRGNPFDRISVLHHNWVTRREPAAIHGLLRQPLGAGAIYGLQQTQRDLINMETRAHLRLDNLDPEHTATLCRKFPRTLNKGADCMHEQQWQIWPLE